MPLVLYIADIAIIYVTIYAVHRYLPVGPSIKGLLQFLLHAVNLCGMLWMSFSLSTAAFVLFVVLVTMPRQQNGLFEQLDDALGKTRFWIFLLSTVTIFLLIYVYLPIAIFLTSPEEIQIHLKYLVTTNLSSAMVGIYLMLLSYMVVFLPRFKVLLTFLSPFALILMFSYSFALPFGYPRMNGLMFEQLPIDSRTLFWRSLFDVALALLVAPLTYYLLKRHKKRVIQGIVVLNVSLLVFAYIKTHGTEIRQWNQEEISSEDSSPLKLTKTGRNALLLFEDRLMSGYVEGILANDPTLRRRLSGFVWYPNTLSSGLNSISGVPAMLGGYDYTPLEMNQREIDLIDLVTEAYLILPTNFTRQGYKAHLLNPRGLGFTLLGDCSVIDQEGVQCGHIPNSLYIRMAKDYGIPTDFLIRSNYSDLMVLLGVMRSVPYAIKNVLSLKGPWKPFLDHSSGTTFRQWCELKALPELTSVEDTAENQLNLFFNLLPHEPYFIDQNGMPTKQVTTFSEAEYRRLGFTNLFGYQHFLAAQSTLHLLADYFDWMKEQGVYDNTKIVIVSDHGIVGEARDPSSRAKTGGTTDNFYVAFRSALFVKDRNSREDLRISEEFKPNAAAPEILCEEIGGCINPYLDDKPIQALGRDDPFNCIDTHWQFNRQKKQEMVVKRLFQVVRKDAYNVHNWTEIEVEQ